MLLFTSDNGEQIKLDSLAVTCFAIYDERNDIYIYEKNDIVYKAKLKIKINDNLTFGEYYQDDSLYCQLN